jgi:hypothetical protein
MPLKKPKTRFNFFWSKLCLATKYDLRKLRELIMATQAELVIVLNDVVLQQKKTVEEIKSVQAAVDTLKEDIAELEKIIADGIVGPELAAAVEAVKVQAQVVDDQIPDLPVPPPVEP